MIFRTTYEASVKPESLRFKYCSDLRLRQLYAEKKKLVERLGGRVAEQNDPIVCFPLWLKVAFLDEFIRHRRLKKTGLQAETPVGPEIPGRC